MSDVEYAPILAPPRHLHALPSTQRRSPAQSFRLVPFALILVSRHAPFIFCQLRKKSKVPHAISRDSFAVDDHGAVKKLAQVIPVEVPAILEFPHQSRRIECISCLPELQHDESPDKDLVERASSEHAEIPNIACLISLITRADLLGRISARARQTMSVGANGRDLK